jgi:Flp pilus assembly protein TadG
MRTHPRRVNDEQGAATLEFALVFPVVAFLIFGLIYGLLAVAAHVSLAHAASRTVRYASLAIDPVAGVYPDVEQVEAYMDDQTPFFTASSCETTVTPDSPNAVENEPVVLDLTCAFPNPAGKVVGFLDENIAMVAHATARRE